MSVAARFDAVREQLREQATPRALAGLSALAAIVAFVAISDLSGAVSEKRQRVEDLRRDAQLQEALLDGEDWAQRAAAAEAERRRVRAQFWRGETQGIVAARLQGAVETAARDAGVERVRVAVGQAPDALGASASVFEIQLQALDRDGQFLALYQTLSRQDAYLPPTAFEWSRSNGRLRMTLAAPAIIAGAEPDADGEEAAR